MSLNCDIDDSVSLLILISYIWDLSSQLLLNSWEDSALIWKVGYPRANFRPSFLHLCIYLFVSGWISAVRLWSRLWSRVA